MCKAVVVIVFSAGKSLPMCLFYLELTLTGNSNFVKTISRIVFYFTQKSRYQRHRHADIVKSTICKGNYNDNVIVLVRIFE